MPIIISISNNKGGVAKTSTTKNLAYALCQLSKKVAVVDADDQSNLKSQYNDQLPFDLLTFDQDIENLQKLKALDYDFVLIDCPPDLGSETVYSYLVSDFVIVPTILANHSILGMSNTLVAIDKIKAKNPNLKLLGVLITFFDRRDKEADTLLNLLKTKLKTQLLSSIIRVSMNIKNSDDQNATVQEYETNKWLKKSTEDFANLAKEILKKIK